VAIDPFSHPREQVFENTLRSYGSFEKERLHTLIVGDPRFRRGSHRDPALNLRPRIHNFEGPFWVEWELDPSRSRERSDRPRRLGLARHLFKSKVRFEGS
jgi:hypothetical protein